MTPSPEIFDWLAIVEWIKAVSIEEPIAWKAWNVLNNEWITASLRVAQW